MALRVTVEEMALLEGCKSRKDYVNKHFKKFPEFYKDSMAAGVKRAENIHARRVEFQAVVDKEKHTVVVPTKVITKELSKNGKVDSLPDSAEILVKILNELRIQTKQYDELLQIARAPKNHFTPVTSPLEPYTGGGGGAPTKTFTAADVISGSKPSGAANVNK